VLLFLFLKLKSQSTMLSATHGSYLYHIVYDAVLDHTIP